jgi:hypothetical protein
LRRESHQLRAAASALWGGLARFATDWAEDLFTPDDDPGDQQDCGQRANRDREVDQLQTARQDAPDEQSDS